MDQKTMMNQMIELNKISFENAFTMLTSFHNQMEKTVTSFVERSGWMPEDGRKVLVTFMSNCSKAREDFKKLMEDGYSKVSELYEKSSIG